MKFTHCLEMMLLRDIHKIHEHMEAQQCILELTIIPSIHIALKEIVKK